VFPRHFFPARAQEVVMQNIKRNFMIGAIVMQLTAQSSPRSRAMLPAFNVTLELVRRGYTEEQIGKLRSGNLLRVWGDVEKVAQQLKKGKA
jgi:Membrane dipeptidase (Peptidase family M19)